MGEEGARGFDLGLIRERMLRLGSRALSTSELIALVLGTGAGNKALELTERLYIEYGGLPAVARLGLAELCDIPGIGVAKATQLRAALDLSDRLKAELVFAESTQIKSPSDAAALQMPEMSLLEQEHLRTMLLDRRNHVLAVQEVYQGSVSCVSIQPGDIFREAIRRNCSSIIVIHNHPSGDPTPSAEDVRTTKTLVQAGKILDIDVLDHLIIGQGRFVSLKERGLGFD